MMKKWNLLTKLEMENKQKYKNVHTIIDDIIEQNVRCGDVVVDSTIGNGNDALKLLKMIGESGILYGFDIQDIAIENTRKLLYEHSSSLMNVKLIKDSHEHVDKYVTDPVDFIIMNLGYLPKGDKTIITKPKSTILFLEKAINLIKVGGLIVIAVYIGFDEGLNESKEVEKYLAKLNQKLFNVLKMQLINQINSPPYIIIIERI